MIYITYNSLSIYHVCVLSCVCLFATPWTSPPGSSVHGILQARRRVGSCSLLQGIFPTPRVRPSSPALAGGFFTTEPHGKAQALVVDQCYYIQFKTACDRDFLDGPVVKNLPSKQGTQVQSLVRELRFHLLKGN